MREFLVPGAGVLVVAGSGELTGVGWSYCRGAGLEVGARRRPVLDAARALARSRAAQGVARVARNVAEATPYGRAALRVVDTATRVARGQARRARDLARGDERALAPLPLDDSQRVAIIRALLASRLNPSALRTVLETVLA